MKSRCWATKSRLLLAEQMRLRLVPKMSFCVSVLNFRRIAFLEQRLQELRMLRLHSVRALNLFIIRILICKQLVPSLSLKRVIRCISSATWKKQATRIRIIFEDRKEYILYFGKLTIQWRFADDTLKVCLFTDSSAVWPFPVQPEKAKRPVGKITLKELKSSLPAATISYTSITVWASSADWYVQRWTDASRRQLNWFIKNNDIIL